MAYIYFQIKAMENVDVVYEVRTFCVVVVVVVVVVKKIRRRLSGWLSSIPTAERAPRDERTL